MQRRPDPRSTNPGVAEGMTRVPSGRGCHFAYNMHVRILDAGTWTPPGDEVTLRDYSVAGAWRARPRDEMPSSAEARFEDRDRQGHTGLAVCVGAG